MNLSLTIDRVLRTTPEKLYEVWTNQQHLSQWFGITVDAEPKVGSPIRFHFGEKGGPVRGNFVALEPHHYVAFTWTQRPTDIEPNTTVHVTFKKEGDGTRLTLRHEGFTDQEAYDSHSEGWLDYMELWSIRTNAGPVEAMRASISGTFPAETDVLAALSGWMGTPKSALKITERDDGRLIVSGENYEASLLPCAFGTSVAISEWGLASEEQRLAARQKWVERFAILQKNG